jgi:hypothetical protein
VTAVPNELATRDLIAETIEAAKFFDNPLARPLAREGYGGETGGVDGFGHRVEVMIEVTIDPGRFARDVRRSRCVAQALRQSAQLDEDVVAAVLPWLGCGHANGE